MGFELEPTIIANHLPLILDIAFIFFLAHNTIRMCLLGLSFCLSPQLKFRLCESEVCAPLIGGEPSELEQGLTARAVNKCPLGEGGRCGSLSPSLGLTVRPYPEKGPPHLPP